MCVRSWPRQTPAKQILRRRHRAVARSHSDEKERKKKDGRLETRYKIHPWLVTAISPLAQYGGEDSQLQFPVSGV